MSEYKHTVAKTQQQGFSQSPEQTIGNAGSSPLDDNLTIKNGVVIAVAASQGKRVFNAAFTATVDQIGNSRLEEAIMIGQKGATYIALGIATGGVVVGIAAVAELATIGITTAVNNHAINLDNDRIRNERGTRINFNAGGYYG